MKLAIDGSWRGTSGIGRFADEIVKRMPAGIDAVEIRRGERNVGAWIPLALRSSLKQIGTPVFWSPGFMPAAPLAGLKQLVTVHDLTHLHYYSRLHRIYYDKVMRRFFKGIDTVFTVSEYSRQEFLAWSGLASDRVITVHHGLDPRYQPVGRAFDLGCPYILYVGNRRSYKNLARLLEAFARSRLPANGIALALSGNADPELAAQAARLNIIDQVRYLGFIEEDALPSVYRGALAVAFTSLYEGFGFPILEGMGCGTPVVTSSMSSMPEIAGGAAVLVDPFDPEAISEALERICFDPALRAGLTERGIARARLFKWDVAATTYWSRIASAETRRAE